jgi:2-iminobutanoate/2-iminopropanoate deaminase
MKDFGKVNSIYSGYFHDKSYPSRVAIAVAELPKGALVEVEAMVAVEDDNKFL